MRAWLVSTASSAECTLAERSRLSASSRKRMICAMPNDGCAAMRTSAWWARAAASMRCASASNGSSGAACSVAVPDQDDAVFVQREAPAQPSEQPLELGAQDDVVHAVQHDDRGEQAAGMVDVAPQVEVGVDDRERHEVGADHVPGERPGADEAPARVQAVHGVQQADQQPQQQADARRAANQGGHVHRELRQPQVDDLAVPAHASAGRASGAEILEATALQDGRKRGRSRDVFRAHLSVAMKRTAVRLSPCSSSEGVVPMTRGLRLAALALAAVVITFQVLPQWACA